MVLMERQGHHETRELLKLKEGDLQTKSNPNTLFFKKGSGHKAEHRTCRIDKDIAAIQWRS